jgi:hypothetical protein
LTNPERRNRDVSEAGLGLRGRRRTEDGEKDAGRLERPSHESRSKSCRPQALKTEGRQQLEIGAGGGRRIRTEHYMPFELSRTDSRRRSHGNDHPDDAGCGGDRGDDHGSADAGRRGASCLRPLYLPRTGSRRRCGHRHARDGRTRGHRDQALVPMICPAAFTTSTA